MAQIAMLQQRAKWAARTVPDNTGPSHTGVITGRVVGFDGQLVPGACVTAVGRAGSATAAAAPDGAFRLAGLAAGSYALEYRDCGAPGRYLTTWSGGTSTQSTAARVQVSAGHLRGVPVMMLRPANPAAAIAAGQTTFRHALAASSRPLSSAAAAKTGQISGRVIGKGKPLNRICVEVAPASGNGEGFGSFTGEHGTYTISHITPGRYYVTFANEFCQNRTDWLQQVYRDDNSPFAPFDGSGTVVRVRARHKTSGINANLRLGGELSGTVTNRSGAKLVGICVEADGQVTGGFIGMQTRTSASGSYYLHALFPGKYPLQFSIGCGSHGTNYAPASHRAVKIRLGQHRTADVTLAPGASVTGRVTLGTSGKPLRGICVSASNATGSVTNYTATHRGGRYRVIGLTGGRYQLQFSPGCNNQGNYSTTFVTARTMAGRQTSGVNAVLQPGGQISGVVTDKNGKPVSGICLQLDGNNSYTALVPESTGDDGSYAITGLSAGTYEVGFSGGCGNSGDYAPTWYQNQTDESLATPVKLSTGATATADQQMLPGAAITGTVTDARGHRLSGICVSAATETQTELGGIFTQDSVTQHGSYVISGLAPGQYQVDFGCGLDSTYADQWFPDAQDAASADLISAGPGRTSGINAVLRPGGTISGVVTGKAGHPLAGVCVTATSTRGSAASFGGSTGIGLLYTNSHGAYKILGLAPGSYDVSFAPCVGGAQYAEQWYRGATSVSSATAVRVRPGKTTAGIDGHLVIGGTISGRVVNASGTPLRNICIFAYDSRAGAFGYAATGKAGTYRAIGLTTGGYTVDFSPCGNQNYVSVVRHARVTASHATRDVNATMQPGGSIGGVVTEGSSSGPPVPDVCVEAVSSNPDNLGGFAGTGTHGGYLVTGLAAGTYQVYFDTSCLDTVGPGLAPQWYDDQARQATANAVTVTVGQTQTGIDAALQQGGYGEITGTISAAGPPAAPLSGACVTAVPLPAGSALPVVAVTTSSGYTVADLPPGRYKVKFSAGCGAAGYATQWWKQKTSRKTATVVTVGSGQDRSGISATLRKNG
ncbi:MAG TPA: carboxypeptidase regulatory-like domain-containing protein [Streptosporangiaceae bacterium]|nr:carboxypeptidase regulatory-like domain-containing protein [Streptosporangiaceae bacterium]